MASLGAPFDPVSLDLWVVTVSLEPLSRLHLCGVVLGEICRDTIRVTHPDRLFSVRKNTFFIFQGS